MDKQSTREELLLWIENNRKEPCKKKGRKLKPIMHEGDGITAKYTNRTLTHKPKKQSLLTGKEDKNFWFNIVIGCSGPLNNQITNDLKIKSREYSKLEGALMDVNKIHDLLNNNPIISPEIVLPRGVRFAPGTFSETIYLKEPTVAEFKAAFSSFNQFIEKNKNDPEWIGGQLNFFFAGHGAHPGDRKNKEVAELVLRDGSISAKEFYYLSVNSIPSDAESEIILNAHGKCRVDLFLDCCYSGLFTSNFFGFCIDDSQGLLPGKLWASSMPSQLSYEKGGSGLFTMAFLNDESSKFSLSDLWLFKSNSLKKGDVGRKTTHEQNPFLINYASSDFKITIPGAVGTTKISKRYAPISQKTFSTGRNFVSWVSHYLEYLNMNFKGEL